jgi:NAD(P)H dehydrogenase (quinone)
MTTDRPKILVTGATGQVGSAVVKSLKDDLSVGVVASVRTLAKAKNLGVPAVELDLDKIETFAPALDGIDRVFLMTGYTVDMLRQSKVFLDVAKKAGVRHVVHLGACGDDDATVDHWVWHQLVERYIEWSGFSFTHIRPEQFMQNLLGYSGKPTVINGVIEQYFGDARLSWVDCEDVAAVSAASLLDVDTHGGQTYRMGYDAQSLYDVAKILTDVIGRPFTYTPRPPEEFLNKVLAAGADPAYMNCVYHHYFAYAEGKIPNPDRVFDNFESITGRKPVTWRDFAAKHAETFRAGFVAP